MTESKTYTANRQDVRDGFALAYWITTASLGVHVSGHLYKRVFDMMVDYSKKVARGADYAIAYYMWLDASRRGFSCAELEEAMEAFGFVLEDVDEPADPEPEEAEDAGAED